MTQNKTKKALLMSVLSMVLCVAMLVGMTFAWFTDTASTGVNKIQAGNLKVELWKADSDTKLTESLKWVKAAGAENEDVLWEPGCKYKLESFRIKNNGNLALKYKMVLKATNITTTTDGKSLLDVIDWTIKVDGREVSTITSDQIKNGLKNGIEIFKDNVLTAKQASGVITVEGHMQSSAGNEYQNLIIDEFGITVLATQASSEFDSFNNTYDADATYPVQDATSLKKALDEVNGSETVDSAILVLTDNFSYGDETLAVSGGKDVTIDLAGKNLTIANTSGDGLEVNNGNLTLANSGSSGTYTFDCTASGSDGIFVSNDEEGKTSTLNITGDVVINVDSRANTAIHAYAKKGKAIVNMDGATVTINGEKQTKGIVVDQNSTLNVKNTEFNLSANFASYSDGNDVVGILLWGQNGKQENINVNIGEGTQISVGGKNAFAQGIQIGMKNGYSQELKVNVDGGEIILNPTENGEGYAFTTYKDVYGKFTMNAGTVSGNVNGLALAYIGTIDLTVNGGTFSVDPTAYLGAGHTATKNNGTWTVK